METTEIIVYISIALIVGFLIVGFISRWDTGGLYESIKKMVTREHDIRYQELEKDDLVLATYQLWESCAFGQVNKSLTVYVKGPGSINRSFLFEDFIKLNFCESIQSVSNGCGKREDVTFSPTEITLPAIVTIECSDSGVLVSSS